jgi:transcriptional regulator with XRE-family HTH domain
MLRCAPMEHRHSRSARLVFAGNVRRVREQRGLSQEKLAELAEVHRAYVGSVERGERNISIDNMEQLAQALGVQLGELLL